MADIVDRTFSLLLHLFRVIPLPHAVIGGFAGNVWGVERNRERLNRSYLYRWSGKLGVVEELHYVLGTDVRAL